ncbi:MAG: hypothetical protein WCO60_19750 [Verrucomicrobiota bacterium]
MTEKILELLANRINRANVNGQEDVRMALLELREEFLRESFKERPSGRHPCFAGV